MREDTGRDQRWDIPRSSPLQWLPHPNQAPSPKVSRAWQISISAEGNEDITCDCGGHFIFKPQKCIPNIAQKYLLPSPSVQSQPPNHLCRRLSELHGAQALVGSSFPSPEDSAHTCSSFSVLFDCYMAPSLHCLCGWSCLLHSPVSRLYRHLIINCWIWYVNELMNDERVNDCMGGWMDRWMDGWIDNQKD